MNIRNNIVSYLYDKDYVISIYDDYIYFFNYVYLDEFDGSKISLIVKDRKYTIIGSELKIHTITKEEILIKGNITDIKVDYELE